jgi:hypothetical protein
MKRFKDYVLRKENYGGNTLSPSMADEEGDGGDEVIKKMTNTGAFPTYSKDEMPITNKNRINRVLKSTKKCNCK